MRIFRFFKKKDDFDKKYLPLLKHGIVSRKAYMEVKEYYYHNLQEKDKDDFDKQYGFILRLGIDTKQSYNEVKEYYLQSLSTLEEYNAHFQGENL